MVRAILLEKKVIEVGVAQLPGMHEHSRDLFCRQVEAIFPDVAVFEVPVFLDLDVVRYGRKIALESSEDSENGKGDLILCRHFRGIVDRVGQQTRLLRLALLVDAQKGMTEHGGRVVQE